MKPVLIYNTQIINEGSIKKGNVLIEDEFIKDIIYKDIDLHNFNHYDIIDASQWYLLPGIIDDQVHFRDPGLTHKADIYTESKAAVAGGITSFMEMPNTIPQATTIDLLEEKYKLASKKSLANYSFYLGATNDNIEEIRKINPKTICGLKVFMGSSTGNMLVDDIVSLEKIFAESPVIIATHCEDEVTIKRNLEIYRDKYGENVPFILHPEIRSVEACYKSSSLAVQLAKKYNTRLHILHISTAKELELFENKELSDLKKITNEVCVHHLWFDSSDYEKKGSLIKWNPAIKSKDDKNSLRKNLNSNIIDVIATDHAPHTKKEKENNYFKAPSGGPMIQHSLITMLELSSQNIITITDVIKKMCHNPAQLFDIDKRGFVRKGYYADLVLVDMNTSYTINQDNLLYKCNWSPLEGSIFKSKVIGTFINGHKAYFNEVFDETVKGKRLEFKR